MACVDLCRPLRVVARNPIPLLVPLYLGILAITAKQRGRKQSNLSDYSCLNRGKPVRPWSGIARLKGANCIHKRCKSLRLLGRAPWSQSRGEPSSVAQGLDSDAVGLLLSGHLTVVPALLTCDLLIWIL